MGKIKLTHTEASVTGPSSPPTLHNFLEVYINGMGTCNMKNGDGFPVVIEYYDGKWILYVWADINKEDYTHKIDLSGALEQNKTTLI